MDQDSNVGEAEEYDLAEAVVAAAEGRTEDIKDAPEPEEVEQPRTLKDGLRAALAKGEEPKEVEPPKKEAAPTEEAKAPEAPKEPEVVAPPADMTEEERAEFSKLPPEAQRYVARRAYETRSYFAKKGEEIKALEAELTDLRSAVPAEIRDDYARQGVSVSDIVRRSIAWDRAFQTDPLTAARQYLDAYGIDPSELTEIEGQPQPNGQQYQQQPGLTAEDVERMVAERLKENEQATTTKANFDVVQSFIESKPLFRDPGTAEQLEARMAPIVASVVNDPRFNTHQDRLEYAYNLVTKGDPEFASLVRTLEAKDEAERSKQQVAKAQAASRSITGGPGSGSPTKKAKDFRENLRMRMSEGAL